MTPDTVRRLMVLHGGDLRHWPEALREEAETLLSASRELRALLEQGSELDQALRAASLPVDVTDRRLRLVIKRAAREIADLTRRPQAKRPSTGG